MFIFTEGIQQEENRTALVNVYLFDLLDHKDGRVTDLSMTSVRGIVDSIRLYVFKLAKIYFFFSYAIL